MSADPLARNRGRMRPLRLAVGAVLWVWADPHGDELILRTRVGKEHDAYCVYLGPALPGHMTHDRLRAGDRLVAAAISAPNGDTLVTAPCGCSLLLLAEPAT